MTARTNKRRPPTGLSAEDLELWRRVTRGDVRLPGRGYRTPDEADEAPLAKPKAGRPAPPREAETGPALPPLAHAHAAAPGFIPGVDKRSAQRLRRGLLPIEARLDLHGKTQTEAHDALDRFLARAQAGGKRCVLVITGKGGRGEGEGPGVLKSAVPRWLDEPHLRARVIAIAPARPQHGGEGALYVLLRKPRG
jgi:DNA-nicking Smr family endonuclease